MDVVVSVQDWSAGLAPVRELARRGCRVLARPRADDERAFHQLAVPVKAAADVLGLRPELVVVSHGDNREGMPWMELCAGDGTRYVSLAHRASEWDWPNADLAARLRAAYLAATAVHFVSDHNHRLTEQMICARLPEATVVRNPFTVSYAEPVRWPQDSECARLACVARLDLESKAHDVLFSVLALPKWRDRALSVEVVGRDGPDARLLRELCAFLQLRSVTFHDAIDDISAVWARCHALVLPSRKEGLPIAVVEAMLSGRPCLVTEVGGSAEVVEDGRSGWVAESPTVAALDRALEAAWRSRDRWAAMGSHAATAIRDLMPADPAGVYAGLLQGLAGGRIDGS